MKTPCILVGIEQNTATLYNLDSHKELSISLTDEEIDIYSELLNEAQNEELENEVVDPIVFYDEETKKLSSIVESESNLFN